MNTIRFFSIGNRIINIDHIESLQCDEHVCRINMMIKSESKANRLREYYYNYDSPEYKDAYKYWSNIRSMHHYINTTTQPDDKIKDDTWKYFKIILFGAA